MHVDIFLGVTLRLFELLEGTVLLSFLFFILKKKNYCHLSTFIAGHKVPRQQFVHFSRLVVKRAVESYLGWVGDVAHALLVSVE